MDINKINKIAQDNEKKLESVKGFKRISELLDIADENKLNDDDTINLIDAFEKLGVKICFKTNKKNKNGKFS